MFGWIGPWELLIVLAVVILIFGPRRIPQAGKSLGRGFHEFKDGITGKTKDEPTAISPAAVVVTEKPVKSRKRKFSKK